MLDEKKGTCCHRCGHVHVKGTSCPTPFLKGERSCERRSVKERLGDKGENPCWKGYHPVGLKPNGDPNCVPLDEDTTDEVNEYCTGCLMEYLLEYEHKLEEAEYRGRKVKLGKPFLTPGGPKKRSVYVKNAKGNVVKVNFGDPNLKIKKNIPARRKSFRARHKCHTAKDRTTPRYWSCKAW